MMTEEQQISKCLDFYLEFKIPSSSITKVKLILEHPKINLTMIIINEEKFEFSWDDIEDED